MGDEFTKAFIIVNSQGLIAGISDSPQGPEKGSDDVLLLFLSRDRALQWIELDLKVNPYNRNEGWHPAVIKVQGIRPGGMPMGEQPPSPGGM